MAKKALLNLILIIACSTLYAQEKLNNNIFRKKLPNGLEVIVVEDHTVPLVTMVMTFKAGAFTETDNVNGITGLYMGMLDRGDKDYSNQQDFNYYAGQLGILGHNSNTGSEYATTYFTLPSANFIQGLDFLNSSIRFPKMDPGEIEKEKAIISNELKIKQSNPYYLLSDSIDHHLWGNLYSRKRGIGNQDAINVATQTSLNSLKDKYFYPNNAIIIVGGDVKPDSAFIAIEKVYGNWTPAPVDPLKMWSVPEFAPLNKSSYVIVESPLVKVPEIALYWQGPDTRNDVASTYAADVFSYIVNQNGSTLKKALIQSGLASDVNVNYLTCKYVGPISIVVTPNPGKVKECIEELKRQIDLMDNDNYITTEQIENAKRVLKINQIRSEDITSSYVNLLSFWWAAASINYYMDYNSNLKKITKNDVDTYVRKYIKGKPCSAGMLIDPELRKAINADDFFKQ